MTKASTPAHGKRRPASSGWTSTGSTRQVLYPNVIGFYAPLFMRMDPEIALACVRAYNDFLTEFASVDPARLIPIAMVPFWDIDAALVEMERCAAMGHRGILFANKYEKVGLPPCWDAHWDPVYAAAQEMALPVNFHVAVGENDGGVVAERRAQPFNPADSTKMTTSLMLGNVEPIAAMITSGLCDRFPELNFVSVESGFGYLPYLLESLDWHWVGQGGRGALDAVAERVLPASVLRHVLVRDHHAPVARAARRQRDVRDGLSAPDQPVSGPDVTSAAAGGPHRDLLQGPAARRRPQGAPRQRRPDLPPRRLSARLMPRAGRRCSCRVDPRTADGQRDASSAHVDVGPQQSGIEIGQAGPTLEERCGRQARAPKRHELGDRSPGARDREPSTGLDSVEHVTAVPTEFPDRHLRHASTVSRRSRHTSPVSSDMSGAVAGARVG